MAAGAPSPPSLLSQLTFRSETLYERLDRAASASPVLDESGRHARLAPWAKAFSRGRMDALERRLSWDGIDPADAAAALDPDLPAPDPAPWTGDLVAVASEAERLARELSSTGPEAVDPWRARAADVPFLELWVPWLRHARAGLGGFSPEVLAPAALEDLEEQLLRDLGRLGELAAYELFDANRGLQGEAGLYRRFVTGVLGSSLGTLYGAYPVLARQMALRARQWQQGVCELVQRLVADRDEITRELGAGDDPGPVIVVRAGLSDRHRGGRQVMALTFASGLEVIYKPRQVVLEAAFARFLSWCDEQGCPWVPPRMKALSRDSYGWMERALHEPLSSRQEVEDWYRRAGALVAFAYLLRGQDLHAENVVATAAGPVLVDAEMLLQPVPVRLTSGPVPPAAAGEPAPGIVGTCRDSGLMTYPEPGADGRTYEWGGLRAEPRRPSSRQSRHWSDINTDAMRVKPGPAWLEPKENAVLLGAELERTEDYAGEVAEGFEGAYRFVLEQRPRLAAPEGPLSWFRGALSRVLFRRSQEYANVLSLLALPRHQRSALSGSMLCEALISPLAGSLRRPVLWPLVTDERAALLAGDLPRFAVAADASTPRDQRGEEVVGYLALSGLEAVSRRLQLFSEEDLGRQLELLRQTLEPVPASAPSAVALASRQEAALEDRCRAVARALGREAQGRLAAGEMPSSALGLERGRVGVALFLAALARESEEGEEHRAIALELLRPLVAALEGSELPEGLAGLPLGACAGWGGIAWGLSWLSALLAEPELAASASRCVTPIRGALEGDRAFDLHSGAAGALVGLLAIGSPEAREVAMACGDHLLAHQRLATFAGAAWASPGGVPLAGWAHGAAGIAWALAALAEATGGERFRVAAAAALGYERALFDPEQGNWPVLVAPSPAAESVGDGDGSGPVAPHGSAEMEIRRRFMVAWCHGAPGVALSRVLLPPAFEDQVLAAELEIAFGTTATAPLSSLDHLCCGNLGRSGVLLAAGRRRGREDLLEQANSLTAAVLDRSAAAGGLSLRDDAPVSAPAPLGLLNGISGAGYHLLRLAGVELPDVLAFELPGEGLQNAGVEQ